MQKNVDNVLKDLTKSLFSITDKKYKDKFENSYLAESTFSLESRDNVFLNDIVTNIDTYSSDSHLNELIENFRALVGKEARYEETIGTHPDFRNLEGTSDTENHYIVSMFIDIKNSTSIYLKTKDLLWTKTFKNTVLRIITIFMRVFDGHIHRLQGDAVFSYFGWKDKCEEDAVIDSLNAASFLLKYIEDILNTQLEELEYEPLKIRIGIDFGKSEDVLWSEYGLSPATEVTTTSLHTDLAAKLQNRASSNTILIGDNIKEFLDLPKEFISIKTYQYNKEEKNDEFILNKLGKRYRMWVFNHKTYLKYFPFLYAENYNLKCIATGEAYFPNISALEKQADLKFEVENAPGIINQVFSLIDYKWQKENRGKEAKLSKADGKLNPSRSFKNEANDTTSYRGHHIMQCEILQKGLVKEKLMFGIFIK